MILSKKDEIGLMMLERSVGGGWHLVCRRVPGTTILENQVRVANVLRIEMDTNTKDLTRVCYSTSGSEEDLVYLDDALFEEPMSAEECEQEYLVLKDNEFHLMEANDSETPACKALLKVPADIMEAFKKSIENE